MFMKTFLLPLALSLVLWSCSSPLDTDTPRKITPLTPAIKVAPVSVVPVFNTATGSYTFRSTPNILIDTTVSPMRFWIDLNMVSVPDTSADALLPVLVEFRVHVDSFPGSGIEEPLGLGEATMYLKIADSIEQFSPDLTSNTANLLITEHQRVPGEKRKVTIYIYMLLNKNNVLPVRQDQVLGKLELEI